MSEHRVLVRWQLAGSDFTGGRYSRGHTWIFDGGQTVPASASPSVVALPHADPSAVDPEEAYVAALSSCHMLTFLHLASKAGFEVLSYEDEAVGTLTKRKGGVPWVSEVVLRPLIEYGPRAPQGERALELHHGAHAGCFIANSVKTAVIVQPRRRNDLG